LRDQDVVPAQAELAQAQRVAVGQVGQLRKREPQWRAADERVAVRRVDLR